MRKECCFTLYYFEWISLISGAFLIPYFVMMMAMGLPIFYLELYLGQYTAVGPIEVFFRLAPGFYGLGYCTLMVISLIIVYYMIIVAWTLYYTFMSFNPRLGWGYCDNSFNTDGENLNFNLTSYGSCRSPFLSVLTKATTSKSQPIVRSFPHFLKWQAGRIYLEVDLIYLIITRRFRVGIGKHGLRPI